MKKMNDEYLSENVDFKKVIKVALTIFGLCILLIVLVQMFYTVGVGERGLLMTFGKPSDTIYSEGLHTKIPFIQDVYKWNIKTQTLHFDNKQGQGDNSEYSSLFGASKDLQDVQVAVVVNYHVDGTQVLHMYKIYGDQEYYSRNIIEPIIRETVKSSSAKYTAEELVTKREQFQNEVSNILQVKFLEKNSIIEKCNIVNFQFSESFTQAIEAKVTAEQNALAAQNKLEQVKFEAQQSIEQAKGQATSINLINTQLEKSPTYISYLATTKWNGVLPIATSGVPFIQLPMSSVGNDTVGYGR